MIIRIFRLALEILALTLDITKDIQDIQETFEDSNSHIRFPYLLRIGQFIIAITLFGLIHTLFRIGMAMIVEEPHHRKSPLVNVSRLPTRKYVSPNPGASASDGVTRESTDLNAFCSVCFMNYETGHTIRVLPCFHEFYASCIDQWFSIGDTCPICRLKVSL